MMDIHALARHTLDAAKKEMVTTGSLTPLVAVVFNINNEIEILRVPAPPEYFNHPQLKTALFRLQEYTAKLLDAEATLTVTDSWVATLTTETQEKVMMLSEQERTSLFSQGVEAICDAGLGVKREAILVVVQTRLAMLTMMNPYTRTPGGGFEFGECDVSEDHAEGRVKIFEQPEEHRTV